MSRGCSAEEPFESGRGGPEKPLASRGPVVRQGSALVETAGTVQTELSLQTIVQDATPKSTIALGSTVQSEGMISTRIADVTSSSLRTEIMDASQRLHSESLAATRTPAFASKSNPVDAIPAEDLPQTARARAVYFAKLAIEEDGRGAFEPAFQLYQECLKYFEMDLRKLDTSKAKV